MGKISDEEVIVAGKRHRRKITFDGRNSKRFECELPPVIQAVLDQKKVDAATFDDCVKAFEAAIRQAESAGTTTRKVIVYEVLIEASFTQGEKYVKLPRDSKHSWRDTGNHGHTLAMAVGVFTETVVKLEDHVRYSYEWEDEQPFERSIYPQSVYRSQMRERPSGIMDWTQEREEWFVAIVRRFEALLLKLDAAFNDPQKVIAAIDTNVKLLVSGWR